MAAYLKQNKIKAFSMQASKKAMDLGSPKSTNLAMVAFYSAFGLGPLSAEDLRSTVEKMSPAKVKGINLKIFDACYDEGRKAASAA
nr:hypothetical protein [Desulfobacula sp.]